MINEFSRTKMLLGEDAMKKIEQSNILVFGVGGVGGYTVEALARCGVGNFLLVDNDTVCISNINRQIIATHKTIGRKKVEVMKERIQDINPNAVVEIRDCFFTAENKDQFDFSNYDYIVDAIDTISSKIILVEMSNESNTPIISSMGCGNKLDPTRFEITDIYKTSVCPLAKIMRKELKIRNIEKLKVLYSKEEAIKPIDYDGEDLELTKKRQTPGSISFVPSVAGLIIAGEVIRDLM